MITSALLVTLLVTWIVFATDPERNRARLYSDIYSAEVKPVEDQRLAPMSPMQSSATVRWSLTERVVTFTVSLPVNLDGFKGDRCFLELPLMLAPFEATMRYLGGGGVSTLSDARCQVRPISNPKPALGLVLTGLNASLCPREHFEVMGQMFI